MAFSKRKVVIEETKVQYESRKQMWEGLGTMKIALADRHIHIKSNRLHSDS